MALEGIVAELWKRTDLITKPNSDFEAVRGKVTSATDAVRDHYATQDVRHPGVIHGVEGISIIDRLEEFSELYLRAAGRTENNKASYAHTMRQMLGDNYGQLRDALKIGDIDTALFLAKNAFVGDNYVAEMSAIVERVNLLPQDQRMAWATHAAQQVGGNDPLAVLESIPRYFQKLRQIRALAQTYITTAPATPAPTTG